MSKIMFTFVALGVIAVSTRAGADDTPRPSQYACRGSADGVDVDLTNKYRHYRMPKEACLAELRLALRKKVCAPKKLVTYSYDYSGEEGSGTFRCGG